MSDMTRVHDDLYQRVAEILEAARSQVARTVNTAMVHAYWLVGREIVEVEQPVRPELDTATSSCGLWLAGSATSLAAASATRQ